LGRGRKFLPEPFVGVSVMRRHVELECYACAVVDGKIVNKVLRTTVVVKEIFAVLLSLSVVSAR
jgi:hypothetical protein